MLRKAWKTYESFAKKMDLLNHKTLNPLPSHSSSSSSSLESENSSISSLNKIENEVSGEQELPFSSDEASEFSESNEEQHPHSSNQSNVINFVSSQQTDYLLITDSHNIINTATTTTTTTTTTTNNNNNNNNIHNNNNDNNMSQLPKEFNTNEIDVQIVKLANTSILQFGVGTFYFFISLGKFSQKEE
jgi:hypothetical protein